MSDMQNMAPFGEQRGSVFSNDGMASVLLTGIAARASNMVNELPCGPKGLNEGSWESEAKTERPSSLWEVLMRRGWERVAPEEVFCAILGIIGRLVVLGTACVAETGVLESRELV